MFNKKSLLITGGTGSFGKEWVKYILHKHKSLKKLVIFSRDELKQYEMEKEYSLKNFHILGILLATLETVID